MTLEFKATGKYEWSEDGMLIGGVEESIRVGLEDIVREGRTLSESSVIAVSTARLADNTMVLAQLSAKRYRDGH